MSCLVFSCLSCLVLSFLVLSGHQDPFTSVRKRHFLSHLYIKCIILPRQARDKHRETLKKSAVFPQDDDGPPKEKEKEEEVMFDPERFAALERLRQVAAARMIQRAWRAYLARKILELAKRQAEEGRRRARWRAAAIQVQRRWRGILARRRVRQVRQPPLFRPFCTKNDNFTKPGSGQNHRDSAQHETRSTDAAGQCGPGETKPSGGSRAAYRCGPPNLFSTFLYVCPEPVLVNN